MTESQGKAQSPIIIVLGSVFDGELVYSDIQVYKFIQTFMSCFQVGSEIVVASIIYTQRLLEMNQTFELTDQNAKCFLLSALALASKFFLDRYEKNTFFYAMGGIGKKQMRVMLDTFIGMVDFNLNITEEEFKSAKIQIKKRISQANGNRLILLEN